MDTKFDLLKRRSTRCQMFLLDFGLYWQNITQFFLQIFHFITSLKMIDLMQKWWPCGGHRSSVNHFSCSRNQFEMIWLASVFCPQLQTSMRFLCCRCTISFGAGCAVLRIPRLQRVIICSLATVPFFSIWNQSAHFPLTSAFLSTG